MKTSLRLAIVLAALLSLGGGCTKKEQDPGKKPSEGSALDPALTTIREHTAKLRKILLDNRDNCDQAVELYGKYVEENLETLKQAKSRMRKLLAEDKQKELSGWVQDMSARSSRDLMLFYQKCDGEVYATKILEIDQRF